jgi:hypothetical protein
MNTAGRLPNQSAALAGTRAGIQTTGPWAGRRQLHVRFAVEAETAQIYSSAALRGELTKAMDRSRYHSIAIIGRDALADVDFLCAAFAEAPAIPVMLDHDGQRPAELEALLPALQLVQVTLDGHESAAALQRACGTMSTAARRGVAHAIVLLPTADASDGPLLRIVEQVHQASEGAQVVLHPPTPGRPGEDDARWGQWAERAMAAHGDVRVLPRWPAPLTPAAEAARGTRNTRAG